MNAKTEPSWTYIPRTRYREYLYLLHTPSSTALFVCVHARFQQGIFCGDRALPCLSDSPSPSFLTNAHSDFRSSLTDRAIPQVAFINNGQMLAVLTLKHSLPPFITQNRWFAFFFLFAAKKAPTVSLLLSKSHHQLAITMHAQEKGFFGSTIHVSKGDGTVRVLDHSVNG